MVVAAIVLILGALATATMALPATGRQASSQRTVRPDWPAVVRELDRRRDAALVDGNEDDLAAVYTPGSPAGRRDLAGFRRLVAAGLRPRGLRLRRGSVVAVDVQRDRAAVRVIDSLSAYELVDPVGHVAARYPGRGPAAWTLTLVRTRAGWQIHDVVRSPDGGDGR